LGVKTANVIDLVGDVDNYRQRAVPLLRNVIDGKGSTPKDKLHASLALLAYDPSQADYLSEQLLSAQVQVEEVPVIITLMEPQKSRVQQRLWEAVKKGTSNARLRAAAALAAYDSENTEWQKVRSDVVTALVSVDPTESNLWIILLRPVGTQLVEPLEARYRDRRPVRDAERPLAALAIADYLKVEPKKLTELILLADNEREFLPFLEALSAHRRTCVDECRQILSQSPPPALKLLSETGCGRNKPTPQSAYWTLGHKRASGRGSSTVRIRRCGVSLSSDWPAWEPITEFSPTAWNRNRRLRFGRL
jgi:hypothetical protein